MTRLDRGQAREHSLYDLVFRMMLSHIPPETAHHLSLTALKVGMAGPGVERLTRRVLAIPHPALHVKALGLDFPITPPGTGDGELRARSHPTPRPHQPTQAPPRRQAAATTRAIPQVGRRHSHTYCVSTA